MSGCNTKNSLHSWGAVAFALCALGQISGLAHLVLIPHTTCVEHGEIVHRKARSAPKLTLTTTAQISSSQAAIDDDHAHCVCLSERLFADLAQASTALILPPLSPRFDEQIQCLTHEERSPLKAVLYRLAPKGSPPVPV